MFRNEAGSCAEDPLFMLLAAEDPAEAMTYANCVTADDVQHNLKVEIEASSFEDPDADSHIDPDSGELNHVDDAVVDALITKKEKQMKNPVLKIAMLKAGAHKVKTVKPKRSKMDKQMAAQGHVASHMPAITPEIARPIDADVSRLIAKRLGAAA